MARIKFRDVRLSKENKVRLDMINSIIREYQAQDYRLTLRQLYYQLVSRDVIPNKTSEYSKLSTLLKEGRMGGVVDWDAIEDRLRTPERPSTWKTGADILKVAVKQFQMDHMKDNPEYIETWVEKDALSGVLSRVTEKYHVHILVNRGYGSASAMYDAYERFAEMLEAGKKCTILYLGDFDPSGKDMIRDIRDRILEMLLAQAERFDTAYFEWVENNIDPKGHQRKTQTAYDYLRDLYESEGELVVTKDEHDDEYEFFDVRKAWILHNFEVVPIALTKAQIKQYNPPPNPAKITDPRAAAYIREHGPHSWEVDALRPEVLNAILEAEIWQRIDKEKRDAIIAQEVEQTNRLQGFLDSWIESDDNENDK